MLSRPFKFDPLDERRKKKTPRNAIYSRCPNHQRLYITYRRLHLDMHTMYIVPFFGAGRCRVQQVALSRAISSMTKLFGCGCVLEVWSGWGECRYTLDKQLYTTVCNVMLANVCKRRVYWIHRSLLLERTFDGPLGIVWMSLLLHKSGALYNTRQLLSGSGDVWFWNSWNTRQLISRSQVFLAKHVLCPRFQCIARM